VAIESKIDALRIFQTPSEELPSTHEAIYRASIDRVINTIPNEAFTGLTTKARIRVTTSACWEKTRKDEGTLGAIGDILTGYDPKSAIKTIDLNTGKPGVLLKNPTVGEYIFWTCLKHVLATPVEILRAVMLIIVREPGKARSVTKGAACLKIVLDVISHLCSIPLEKGLDSSKSGMGAAHHGWNLFKAFSHAENKDLFFDRSNTVELEETDEGREFLTIMGEVWMLSTDYKTATDYVHHRLAKIAASKWMERCGIPPLLRSIALSIIGEPRDVFFKGQGPLEKIGKPYSEKIRYIRMTRGVLMGDPLTKIILHLINASVRALARDGYQPSFWERHFYNPEGVAKAFQKSK